MIPQQTVLTPGQTNIQGSCKVLGIIQQTSILNNAHQKIPTIYHPENNDWIQENNRYHLKWFERDHSPNYVRDSLKTKSGIYDL